jgi:hypothetical protein
MAETGKKRGHKKDKKQRDQHRKDHKAKKPQRGMSVPTNELEGAGLPVSEALAASTSVPPTSVVDFWFDPTCPWAWLTSRWMLEVEKVRPVKTLFHVMSLSVLNQDRDIPEEYRTRMDAAWAPARVALGVGEQYGQEQLAAFYTALGTRFHPRQEDNSRGTLEAALTEVGLPPEMADLGDTGENDDALRRSHNAGMDAVGVDVGTPVLLINGSAIFGPVMSPSPVGEEAGRIFDAVLELTSYAGFFELKRSRTADPIFD